jgi:protein-tyrosine phosphatase
MDFTDRPGDVADPWYSGRFDVAYKDILEGCTALLKKLEEDT